MSGPAQLTGLGSATEEVGPILAQNDWADLGPTRFYLFL